MSKTTQQTKQTNQQTRHRTQSKIKLHSVTDVSNHSSQINKLLIQGLLINVLNVQSMNHVNREVP